MNVESIEHRVSIPDQPFPSGWRLCGVIGTLLSTSILFAQMKSLPGGHPFLYLGIIAFEASLLALALGDSDSRLRAQIASLFQRPRELFLDFLVAGCIWFTWSVLSRFIVNALGNDGWGSAQEILPNSSIELGMWVLLSLSAGLSE